MIIRGHYREVNMFILFIFNGFKIVDPLLHVNHSIDLNAPKILFLNGSVPYQSQI